MSATTCLKMHDSGNGCLDLLQAGALHVFVDGVLQDVPLDRCPYVLPCVRRHVRNIWASLFSSSGTSAGVGNIAGGAVERWAGLLFLSGGENTTLQDLDNPVGSCAKLPRRISFPSLGRNHIGLFGCTTCSSHLHVSKNRQQPQPRHETCPETPSTVLWMPGQP